MRDKPRSLFKEVDPEYFFERYDTRKLLNGVRRHIFLIAVCAIIWGLIGGLITYRFLTTYRAEAVVLFQEEFPKTIGGEGGYTFTNFSLSTALDMITLTTHFQAIKSILGLDLTPQEISATIDVPTPKNESNLIRIVATADNPNLAIDIANTLARVSVKSSQDFNQRQLQQALESFKKQLDETRQRLVIENRAIEKFKKEQQYFEMDAEYSLLLQQIAGVRHELAQATLNYNSLLVEYENLRREAESLPEKVSVAAGSSSSPLQTRIQSLQASLAEARSKYSKKNPKVQRIEEELNTLLASSGLQGDGDGLFERNTLKEKLQIELMRMQGKVRAAQKKQQDIALHVEEMEAQLETLPQEQMAFAQLLNAKNLTEEQIKSLNSSVETTQLMLNVPKGSLALYQLAEKSKPLRESVAIKLFPFALFFFGLGFGILTAWVLEIRDPYLCTGRQVEIHYTIPVIATVPTIQGLTKDNIEKQTLFYIRDIADRLAHLPEGYDPKRQKKGDPGYLLAFVSTVEGEGKSFFSQLLAAYYANFEKKVLHISVNPRSGEFSRKQGRKKIAPLEDYLRGDAELPSIIAKGPIDMISMEKPDPALNELLKTARMQALWDQLKHSYDLVVIDGPALLENSYGLNLSETANGALLVIGSTTAPKKLVDESLHEFETFDIVPIGIILNQVLPLYIDDIRIKREWNKKRRRTKTSG